MKTTEKILVNSLQVSTIRKRNKWMNKYFFVYLFYNWPGRGPERIQACCASSEARPAYEWAALLSVEGRAWWRNTYKIKNIWFGQHKHRFKATTSSTKVEYFVGSNLVVWILFALTLVEPNLTVLQTMLPFAESNLCFPDIYILVLSLALGLRMLRLQCCTHGSKTSQSSS